MKMNGNNENLLIIGALIVIAAIAGVVVLKCKHKNGHQFDQKRLEPDIDTSKAKEQFKMHIQNFAGYYESLYRVANSETLNRERAINLIQQIDVIVKSIHESKDIIEWWGKYFSNYSSKDDYQLASNVKMLLNVVLEMGIQRDKANKIIVSGDTSLRYIDADDRVLVEGTEMRIISPYWSYENNILERGLITNS